MLKKGLILLSVIILACNRNSKVEGLVRRGNVVYDSLSFQSGIPLMPPYVANGIVGGCFDHMGFQSTPNTGTPNGRTHIGYIRHYDLRDHGRHVNFPLFFINASFVDGSSVYNLIDSKNYLQELDLYTGVLNTQYDLYGNVEINAFAHQSYPNLFVYHIKRETETPSKQLVLQIECETSQCQNNDSRLTVDPVSVSINIKENRAEIRSTTDASTTDWIISCPGAKFDIKDNKVLVYLKNGENDLRFFIKRPDCIDESVLKKKYDDILEAHTKVWKDEWLTSWVDFPEARMQQIWMRMKYYAISCFPTITEKPTIPEGLTCNIWGFTFPQDVYYIAENLPRLGSTQRAEAAMKYWLDVLPEAQKYSQRIMKVDGAYYPWTPPFQDWDNYEKDGLTSPDSYELHNPAYVAATVWHYFKYTTDTAVLKKYYPVIKGVYRFYSNIWTKNTEGTYDIYHENARGQDEASSIDGRLKNLLCAGYSAEYMARITTRAAMILGDTALVEEAADIVRNGITRKTLLRADGIYTTYEGDNRPAGSQKHPVQLNPIVYLPMADLADDAPVVKAWKNRYELTLKAKKPITLGWTLGDFLLASSRMRAPLEMKKDLDAIQPCHGADPRWIQFYESSFWENWHVRKAYYFPMMALYLQAFTDMVVQDWRGYTDVFACIPNDWKKEGFSFNGIRTLKGVIVNGTWKKNKFRITLTPNHAASIKIRISQDANIKVKGQAEGPSEFKGNEVVELKFDGGKEIELRN